MSIVLGNVSKLNEPILPQFYLVIELKLRFHRHGNDVVMVSKMQQKNSMTFERECYSIYLDTAQTEMTSAKNYYSSGDSCQS